MLPAGSRWRCPPSRCGTGGSRWADGPLPQTALVFITHRKKTTSLKMQTREASRGAEDAADCLRISPSSCQAVRVHAWRRGTWLLTPDPDQAVSTSARQLYFTLFFSHLSGFCWFFCFLFFFFFVVFFFFFFSEFFKKNLGRGATTGKREGPQLLNATYGRVDWPVHRRANRRRWCALGWRTWV